jgi:DNA-binding CsgD family transcriptional regulator
MHNCNINPHSLLRISGNVWMYWKDLDGYYLGCNDLMAKCLKLPSAEKIVNKSDWDLGITANEAEFYRRSDKRVIQTKTPMQFYDTATLFGKKLEFNVIKTPLYENKRIIGIIGLSYYTPEKNSDLIMIDGIILSLRESQIVRELVRGRFIKQIASMLGLSPRTVEDYLGNIKKKLNVPSKNKLIEKVFDYVL